MAVTSWEAEKRFHRELGLARVKAVPEGSSVPLPRMCPMARSMTTWPVRRKHRAMPGYNPVWYMASTARHMVSTLALVRPTSRGWHSG